MVQHFAAAVNMSNAAKMECSYGEYTVYHQKKLARVLLRGQIKSVAQPRTARQKTLRK